MDLPFDEGGGGGGMKALPPKSKGAVKTGFDDAACTF